jgi:hypothetical protein
LKPARLDVGDTAAIRASLEEHGYACIRQVASAAQLFHARALLWEHLEGRDTPSMRQPRPRGWKRGKPTTWVEGHGDGLMSSTTHCAAMWYVRTLPGVVGAFEAAYGEPAVAACACRPTLQQPCSPAALPWLTSVACRRPDERQPTDDIRQRGGPASGSRAIRARQAARQHAAHTLQPGWLR